MIKPALAALILALPLLHWPAHATEPSDRPEPCYKAEWDSAVYPVFAGMTSDGSTYVVLQAETGGSWGIVRYPAGQAFNPERGCAFLAGHDSMILLQPE